MTDDEKNKLEEKIIYFGEAYIELVQKNIKIWNEEHGKNFYIPNEDELNEAYDKGTSEAIRYAQEFNIGIKDLDYIKCYAFSTIFLHTESPDSNPHLSTAPIWLGIARTIQEHYNHNFEPSDIPQFDKTCEVLDKIAKKPSRPIETRWFCYAYMKGMEETARAIPINNDIS